VSPSDPGHVGHLSQVTSGRHVFGNCGMALCVVDRGNPVCYLEPVIHKTFGRSFKFCKELTLQTRWNFKFWSLFW